MLKNQQLKWSYFFDTAFFKSGWKRVRNHEEGIPNIFVWKRKFFIQKCIFESENFLVIILKSGGLSKQNFLNNRTFLGKVFKIGSRAYSLWPINRACSVIKSKQNYPNVHAYWARAWLLKQPYFHCKKYIKIL